MGAQREPKSNLKSHKNQLRTYFFSYGCPAVPRGALGSLFNGYWLNFEWTFVRFLVDVESCRSDILGDLLLAQLGKRASPAAAE